MLNVVFSQFRIFSHHLESDLGRYNNIGRNERKCHSCYSNMIESEHHFLLCCPIYNDLRRKYISRCNWPNLTHLNNVAKIISEAMKIREQKLKTIAAS